MTAVADLPTRLQQTRQKVAVTFADFVARVCQDVTEHCRVWDEAWAEMHGSGDDAATRALARDALGQHAQFLESACEWAADLRTDQRLRDQLARSLAEVRDCALEAEMGPQPEPDLDPAAAQAIDEELAAGGAVPIEDVIRELQG